MKAANRITLITRFNVFMISVWFVARFGGGPG